MNATVNDLGITCLSMGARSGQENPTDYFQQWIGGGENLYSDVVNDDADPNSLNANGFQWTGIDWNVEHTIAKFRAAMVASGQTPCIRAGYTDFDASLTTGFKHATNGAEYGEYFLALFDHLDAKYGWVPDYIDIVTEPENGSWWWTPTALGNAIVSVSARLGAAGYHPRIIAPSYVGIDGQYTDRIATLLAQPGVRPLVTDVGYHLYSGQSAASRAALVAAAGGTPTVMTEWIGGDQTTLMSDLTVANATGWMANSLAFPDAPDDGGNYFTLSGTSYALGSRARYLRHFFRHIRPGALRIAASSSNGALTPVAFINTGGGYTVVANATGAQAFTVGPLPAGTYGIRYTTSSETYVNAGDQTIGTSGTISTSIPAAGSITIFNIALALPPRVVAQ